MVKEVQPPKERTMATTHARRDDGDGIVTVTFTRDEKLNAVSPEMYDLIASALEDLATRDAG
jgi:enoyl-CoA hydratase